MNRLLQLTVNYLSHLHTHPFNLSGWLVWHCWAALRKPEFEKTYSDWALHASMVGCVGLQFTGAAGS
jgi:hypothetical protein